MHRPQLATTKALGRERRTRQDLLAERSVNRDLCLLRDETEAQLSQGLSDSNTREHRSSAASYPTDEVWRMHGQREAVLWGRGSGPQASIWPGSAHDSSELLILTDFWPSDSQGSPRPSRPLSSRLVAGRASTLTRVCLHWARPF